MKVRALAGIINNSVSKFFRKVGEDWQNKRWVGCLPLVHSAEHAPHTAKWGM